LALEKERIETQAELEGNKLGAKMANQKEELQARTDLDGYRMGIDIAKSKEKTVLDLLKTGANQKGK
jgi:hypothetical protein